MPVIEEAVREALGAAISEVLFTREGVGSVAGLALADGRRVVVKLHRAHVRAERLAAVIAALTALRRAGIPCPEPLCTPLSIAGTHATFEALVDRGHARDGHDPAVRAELARRLHAMSRAVDDAALAAAGSLGALGPSWFSALPRDVLWPRPHLAGVVFEPEAWSAHAIDRMARFARRVPRAGRLALGHFDWRAAHARFAADGDADGHTTMTVAYDWDSLHVDLEPVAVGVAAQAFCVTWHDDGPASCPSLDEVRAFVADYEAARGAPFEPRERVTMAGALVWSLAYTARCVHALGPRASVEARAFFALLERYGPLLLERL